METTRFGRYTLIDRLGAGGMGEIYVALCGELPAVQKVCALKKIRPALSHKAEFMARFWDEARVVIALSHPNIVAVYEIGSVDGEYFLAMEFVEGHDLWRVLTRAVRLGRHLSVRAALYIARELLSALDYCHNLTDASGRHLKLVHRDVSPGNVLLSYDGRVKLTDFGLALSAGKEVKTKPKVVFGKPGYLAPEQLAGQPIDHRVDVFSVGVLLFEMLTGERFVHPSLDPALLLRDMERRSTMPPSSVRARVPAKVDAVIGRALAYDPQQRYPSARQFHDAVQMVLSRIDPLYGPRKLSESVLSRMFDDNLRRRLTLPGEADTQVLAGGQAPEGALAGRSLSKDPNEAAPRIDSDLEDTVVKR